MPTQAHHSHEALARQDEAKLAAAEARGFSAEVISQIHEYRATHKPSPSWEDLARSMGMSSGTLHQCVHGTYKGNPEPFEAKAISYFAMLQLRESTPHEIFPTAIATQFLEAVQAAKASGEAVAVVHLPGVGASVTASLYARKDSTAILITARRGIRSGRGSMLHELRRAITRQKWRRKDERAGTMAEDVCRRLKGSGRVIVIDHADECTRDALSLLLSLREETGCPVILVGAPRLHERIDAVGEGEARPGSVGLWRELRFPNASSLTAAVHGLCRVLAPDHAEVLYRPAYQAAKESHGNLRALSQRIRLAVSLMEQKQLDLDVAFDHARLQLVSCTTAEQRLYVMSQRRTEATKALAQSAA